MLTQYNNRAYNLGVHSYSHRVADLETVTVSDDMVKAAYEYAYYLNTNPRLIGMQIESAITYIYQAMELARRKEVGNVVKDAIDGASQHGTP